MRVVFHALVQGYVLEEAIREIAEETASVVCGGEADCTSSSLVDLNDIEFDFAVDVEQPSDGFESSDDLAVAILARLPHLINVEWEVTAWAT